MIVLILLAFVSAVLVALAVGLFAWTVRQRTFDHAEHLALLPLRSDAADSPSVRAGAEAARRAALTPPSSRSQSVGTDDGFGGE